MTTWALDLDGVIWRGSEGIPGSPEAIKRLRSAGHQVAFVTNNSYSSMDQHESKLASFGIEAVGAVVSSAQAAATQVEAGERVYVLGGPGVREAVEERGATVAEAGDRVDAVIVGLDRELTYTKVAEATTHVLAGARFIGTNSDPTYPAAGGLLPGAGSIIASVAVAVGRPPAMAGKPHLPIAEMVRDRFGEDGIMVGDRPETDGDFAAQLGFEFGLVFSGVTQPEDMPVSPLPDYTAPNLTGLVAKLLD